MKKSSIASFLTFFLFFALCSSCANKAKSLNPNGDSELALLMREMYDDGMKTKQQLLDGTPPEVHVMYKRIHTAMPTESMEITPNFAVFATAYEAAMDSFISTDASNKVAAYQHMVNSCMNCHQVQCPGPKVKIKHLYFTENELALMASKQ